MIIEKKALHILAEFMASNGGHRCPPNGERIGNLCSGEISDYNGNCVECYERWALSKAARDPDSQNSVLDQQHYLTEEK